MNGSFRHAIRVRGTVQGVGFRPAVFRLARAERLGGFVRNDTEGVWIEIEGDAERVARFVDVLRREAPPLSRIDAIEIADLVPLGESTFRVAPSVPLERTGAVIPADAATCDACLRDLFDPSDRRYRYPFVNCTDCGPRYTIVYDLPYDRAQTTMASFAMCDRCRAEYDDPGDRRFHAEPNACPECGPSLTLVEKNEPRLTGEMALERAVDLLCAGAIVAVKGLGGFQLATVAADQRAVARLRARKRRPHKPFALMARDLETVLAVARASEAEQAALSSPARPIVLFTRRDEGRVAEAVAPDVSELGIMLPPSPLHHLLLHDGAPLLVMTSGNRADEPICKDDDEALAKLAGIADAWLLHDRPIHTRADDSVVRVVAGVPMPVRRARGLAPDAVSLASDGPSVLAVGAALKSTVCITRGAEAFVSQHIGDLDELDAQAFFGEVVDKLGRLLRVDPAVVAHDLHPDYPSTRWALASGLRTCAVQHHHAHVASCLADNGRDERAIGIAFDGTGCGPAGDLWGGEVLAFDLEGFERVGHLRPIALAGGEAAIREPWRVAAAALLDCGEELDLLIRIPAARLAVVAQMIARGTAAPLATGAGRWFDAVGSLALARDFVSYEAQAAIELDALAGPASGQPPYPIDVDAPADRPFVVDLRPALRQVAADLRRGEAPARIAAGFYATMAEVVLACCRRVRDTHDLGVVALSGGCFQSRLLTESAKVLLEEDGFEVLLHRRVPPNDGGISLGQAAIAAKRAKERGSCA